jgi:hypothetical protein
MSKFLTDQTQCLYLDQFAVTRICVASPPAEWTEVSALIKQGVKEERLFCPHSVEHLIETTGLDKESAKTIDKESRKLSSGWCFFPEVDVTARYFICKVRNIKMAKRHFIHRKAQHHIDESNVYEKINERRGTFKEMVEEANEPVNVIRTAARGGKPGKKETRDSVIKIIKDRYAQEMMERLYLLGTQGRYRPRMIMLAGLAIPFWADIICSHLVNRHDMTQEEAIKAFNFLQNEGIDAIPTLSIRASLEAMKAYKGTRETSNDQLDIMRIASALPFADIMLIDGPRASEVRELGLDQKFKTIIHSGKKTDLMNLRAQLNTLIKGI